MPNSFWKLYIALHCSTKMYSKKRKKDLYIIKDLGNLGFVHCFALPSKHWWWLSSGSPHFEPLHVTPKPCRTNHSFVLQENQTCRNDSQEIAATCEYRMRLWQAADVSEALLASNAFWAWLSAKATSAKSTRLMANWLTFWLCRTSCKLARQQIYLQKAIFHTCKSFNTPHPKKRNTIVHR